MKKYFVSYAALFQKSTSLTLFGSSEVEVTNGRVMDFDGLLELQEKMAASLEAKLVTILTFIELPS